MLRPPKLLKVFFSEYTVNIMFQYEKKCVFYLCFQKTHVHVYACNFSRNGPVRHYIPYFEALKGLLQKKESTLFFFLIFALKVSLPSWKIIKLIPLGPQPHSTKSPFSPCDYTRVKSVYMINIYINCTVLFTNLLS